MPTAAPDDESHLARLAQRVGVVAAPPHTHHHIVLEGRRFHYVEWGSRGNPPILFLHGGNQSARTWDVICMALADRFHCIALDARGHGDSEWSYEGDYAPASQARDVERFAQRLGWSWFALVGMSMGGLTALHYAAQHCGRLAGLVAVDVGPFLEMQGGVEITRFVEANKSHGAFEDFVTAAMRFNPRREVEFLRHSLHHTVREMADGSWMWRSDRRHAFNVEQMIAIAATLEHELPRIACPVLVVKGAESPILSGDRFQRFVAALPDGRGAVVENAGHTVQGDNPRGLIAALNTFFAALPPPFGARRSG
jgi:esterase